MFLVYHVLLTVATPKVLSPSCLILHTKNGCIKKLVRSSNPGANVLSMSIGVGGGGGGARGGPWPPNHLTDCWPESPR